MIPSYPKIYNLGHAAITELLFDDVVIEEKIDGSQFSFGIIGGELECKSHHQDLILDAAGMFQPAVDAVIKIQHLLPVNLIFRGEFLAKPKQNTLCYGRIPNNNIIIFDIDDGQERYFDYKDKEALAKTLGFECVPQFVLVNKFNPEITFETFKKWLEKISCLGGQTIEGIVIKNYNRFARDGHALMGKFVSEKFKERNQKNWKEQQSGNVLIDLGQSYRTESRWEKAIQHLKEKGELTNEPKDIGSLLKEINQDVLEECSDEIKNKLFKWAWPNLAREVTKGFPQWYKGRLAKLQFGEIK